MITIQTQSDGVLFNFQDSTRYLYGDGSILTPYNSLTLIADESNVLTFRKSASNDIFITAGYDELGYSSKEEAINDLKTKLFKATGGGGSESGITSGDVQTMIDNSLEDYYTDDEVDAALSGKADTSAVTAVANDVSTLSGQVATKVATSDFSAYSAATDARIAEDEEVTAAALNDLQENKADTSAVTAVNNALTAHTSDTGIHVSAQEKNAWNAKAEPYSAGTGIEISGNVISATGGSSVTVDATLDSGSTNPVANSAITTAIDNAKAYYISFATIATTGIRDEDWDGIVAAIDDHRPIYAGYPRTDGGILYYGVECMNKNVSNTQIILTSSDDSSHYFYTFTKNGSNDYTFTSETRPYTTQAEKDSWNAKQDALSAGTGIEISGNVISATGGGGATYSAGTNIRIDTANTINCTLPITANTSNLQGYLLFGSNISVWGSESNGRYQIAIGKQISNPAYTEGQVAICPADTTSSSVSELTGEYPIGIGHMITSRGNGAVAIGDRANANGKNYVAIGREVDATGTTKMNLNNQIKVDTNNQVYIKDKTNTTDVCIQDAIAALGGLKLVQCTQAEYDALVSGGTVDSSTIYFITNVVS